MLSFRLLLFISCDVKRVSILLYSYIVAVTISIAVVCQTVLVCPVLTTAMVHWGFNGRGEE